MKRTGYGWIDPALSLLVAGVILASSWRLLKDSFRLQLGGVPPGIDLLAVQAAGQNLPGVQAFEHLHVWPLSTTQNALTGLVLLRPGVQPAEGERIKEALKQALENLNIHHATLETSFAPHQAPGQPYDSPL
jgi:cobalt-zinc-cadmium efflux system protein